MIPSKYQQAVYDFVPTMKPGMNMAIKARAGSGKTSTIVNVTSIIDSKCQTVFLAFNKNIAKELQNRVPMHVQAATINSFGWGICMKNIKRPRLNEYKTDDILKSLVDNKDYRTCRSAVKSMIGLLKAWIVLPEEVDFKWELIAKKYGIEIPDVDNFGAMLERVLQQSFDLETEMDFDDQVYFPVVKNFPFPAHDFVLVDEAQDLNALQIEFVSRLSDGGCIIAVGDDRQAIYGFRGADPDALDTLIAAYNATVFPLSICYRCPTSVIKLAQEIVPDIEPSPDAKEGIAAKMPLDNMRKEWRDEDFVLCRCTAPLISECLRMIRSGKKAFVRGRDIGKNLLELLEKIVKQFGPDISDSVERYRYQQTTKLVKMGRDSELISINDKCDTLIALYMDTQEDKPETNHISVHDELTFINIKARIEMIFADNAPGTIFSTVHKAKGLEAKRVFILEPQLMPHPMAKQDWQKKQEMNLKYVAITRATEELYIAGTSNIKEKRPEIKDVEVEYHG